MREPWEIWNAILDKASRDVSTLTDIERTIYLVNHYICDLDLGSVTSVLYNLSPAASPAPVPWTDLRTTAEAVREVGDLESAGALTELATRFECAPYVEASSWEDFRVRALPSDLEEEITQVLEQRGPILWQLLEKFTVNCDA